MKLIVLSCANTSSFETKKLICASSPIAFSKKFPSLPNTYSKLGYVIWQLGNFKRKKFVTTQHPYGHE